MRPSGRKKHRREGEEARLRKEERRRNVLTDDDFFKDFLADLDEYKAKVGLTDQQIERLEEKLNIGMSLSEACLTVGVGRSRVLRALKRDYKLARRIFKAQQNAKAHHIKRIYDAEKNWQASAWWLERVFRKEFALVQTENSTEERAIQVRKVVRTQVASGTSPAIHDRMNGNGHALG